MKTEKCEVCGKLQKVDDDGKFVYHDRIPPCRWICSGSLERPEDVRKRVLEGKGGSTIDP